MIDELRAMAIFAEVVKLGSFRAAAHSLSLSPSVVSYHVSQLEEQTGTALLYRSTRKLSLSHDGEILYAYIQNMMQSALQGLEQINQNDNSPTGNLKITLPSALIKSPITEQITSFAKQYSRVKLNISFVDTREDIIENGIDLAIRAGELPDSSLKAKRVGEIRRKLVCSPEYFASKVEPIAPQNLSTWRWVKLSMLTNQRTFTHRKYENVTVHFEHQLSVNNVEAMTQLCVLGNGLSTPADYQVDELISQKKLVHVLPDWSVEPKPLYAVWPPNVTNNSLVKKLVNHLS